MIIKTKAFSRGGLIGNPSDGYFGKTIAFTFSNFCAEVTLYESPELEIIPTRRDHSVFNGIDDLVNDVSSFGYYGGIRLLKAAIKRFHDYTRKNGIQLHDKNFTIRYKSDIPHLVGLAGSSAIITACFRALSAFYGITIPKVELPNLILSVEKKELGISAGLQDRVAQAYEGLVYMDFNKERMEKSGHGIYRNLDIDSLPNLYVAYRADLSEGSEVFHSDMRERFERKDPEILDAIAFWAELTNQVADSLQNGQQDKIGALLNANFDRRAEVSIISDGNIKMIQTARSVGASAKFTGSGGAIVGTYDDDKMYQALLDKFSQLNIKIIKPNIVCTTGED